MVGNISILDMHHNCAIQCFEDAESHMSAECISGELRSLLRHSHANSHLKHVLVSVAIHKPSLLYTYPDLEITGVSWIFLVVSISLVVKHALDAGPNGGQTRY